MSVEELTQHDEWQAQLQEQDDEEKRRVETQVRIERELKESGWTTMDIVPVYSGKRNTSTGPQVMGPKMYFERKKKGVHSFYITEGKHLLQSSNRQYINS